MSQSRTRIPENIVLNSQHKNVFCWYILFVGDKFFFFAIFIPVFLHTRANMRIYFRKKREK